MDKWRTVDVSTHPLPNGRWVAVTERIRDNASGEVREHHSHSPLYDGEVHPSTWIWEEGNYSCDCNRRLFFLWAAGLDEDDQPCGDGGYSVQLVNPEDGTVFYDEFVAAASIERKE